MKRFLMMAALFVCCTVFGARVVNVRAFGAKGDGKTDDTAAFQKALDAARVRYPQDNTPRSAPEVLVPRGVYLLSDTLVFESDLMMRGESEAVLKQSNPAKDLLYGHKARHGRWENLTFDGGNRQLLLWTENKDASIFTVTKCRFLNSASTAVECLSPALSKNGEIVRDAQRNVTLIAPYEWRNNTLTPLPQPESMEYFNSTKILVTDSEFLNCMAALATSCDGTTMRRCRMESRAGSTRPLITIGNRTQLSQLNILVHRHPTAPPPVVKMNGSSIGAGVCLDFHDSQIDTDNGSGICLVSTNLAVKSYIGQSLLLQNIQTQSAGCPENAIVHVADDSLPALVMFNGVTESGKGKVRALGFAREPDETTVKRSISADFATRYTPQQSLALSFTGNSASIDVKVPKILQPYLRTLPETPAVMEALPKELSFSGKLFEAWEFDIGDNQADTDTENLKKMIARAAQCRGAVVFLPGREIKLTETLTLPPEIHLTSYGTAQLTMADGTCDHLLIQNPERVKVSKIIFSGGRHAVRIETPAGKAGRVDMTGCGGRGEREAVVKISGNAGKKLTFVMHDCTWFCHRIYDGDATSYLDNLWIESKNDSVKQGVPPDSTVFINRGKMQLSDLLGVPLVFRRVERNGIPPAGTPVADHRWIDNYGEFNGFHNRFGGEFGGHPVVYHHGKAQTRIYGGFAWFNNGRAYKIPCLADSADADFKMFNVICAPFHPQDPIVVKWRDAAGNMDLTAQQELYNVLPDTTQKVNLKK